MNPHVKLATVTQSEISPAEWRARVDLAATYRLIAHYGWADVIYNHSSMRVPGEERKFLIKRHELLYTEVTPSNLVKVSMDDDLDESAGVNRPGFTLHGGVLSARPDVNCAVHVHTDIGMALAGLQHGLRMVSQPAVRFYNRVGYHDHEGITEDFGERTRINNALGKSRALIMRNHGLLTVGQTAREAFVLMKSLIEAAAIQHKNGSDRRRLDRNPGRDLRKDRAPIRASRFRSWLGRLAGVPAHARCHRPAVAELSAVAPNADEARG